MDYGPFCEQQSNEYFSITGLNLHITDGQLIIYGFQPYGNQLLQYDLGEPPSDFGVILPLWEEAKYEGIHRYMMKIVVTWDIFHSLGTAVFLPGEKHLHNKNPTMKWSTNMVFSVF